MVVKNIFHGGGKRAIYCRKSLSRHYFLKEREAARFGGFFMAHELKASQLKTMEGKKMWLNKCWYQWLIRRKPKNICDLFSDWEFLLSKEHISNLLMPKVEDLLDPSDPLDLKGLLDLLDPLNPLDLFGMRHLLK